MRVWTLSPTLTHTHTHTLAQKYINRCLRFRTYKIVMRWGPLTGTLSLLCCLKHLGSPLLIALHSGFRCRFILYPFCSNALIIWGFLYIYIYFLYHPFSSSCVAWTFAVKLKTFLLSMTVAMFSHYQSPVNCRSRNVEENLMKKVNYCYYCQLPGLVSI
jgi:hypothetical protein